MTFIEEHEEFHGDTGAITGIATYDYDIESFYDADIGGRDGVGVSYCELVSVAVDGLILTRDQIVLAISEEGVKRAEESAFERIDDDVREAA